MTTMQHAVITGANQGLGQAIAMTCAKLGYNLTLAARNTDKLAIVANNITQLYPNINVTVVPTDVCDPIQCQRLIKTALQNVGYVDVLINNAGIAGKIALLQEITDEEISQTIDTNLKAPIFLMKAVIPSMVARYTNSKIGGSIININSVAGQTAYPYWSVYCASKFGLKAVTDSVAEEQRKNGIKIVGIHPGAVDTPLWDGIELSANRTGMLTSQDVANAVAYVLQQPDNVHIPELTIRPLVSVL
jgi:NADP-dependent 3-hydroxy acid dehydrogenase YdfG